MKQIKLRVNHTWISGQVRPNTTLLAFLRDHGFTEVKKGCGEGDCGACTVILDGKAVPSCLVFALQANGGEIITAGEKNDALLEELKAAFISYDAVQCGFCSPGALMTARWLLSENPTPNRIEIRTALAGNFCRCTGYKKIVDAVEHVVLSTKTE